MKITGNKIYFSYILLGLLYFISKINFYIFGFVYLKGVTLGLIATVLTITVGALAFKEYKEKSKPIAHWIAILIPLIIIPLVPMIMIHNLGEGIFQIEKIAILVIFGCLAVMQIVLAILMFKNLEVKND